MHFSTATFKVAVWGFMWPTLPLTWQTQGAPCGLGEDGIGPSRCLCRDVEMGGWMGWTPESKSRPCSMLSKNPGSVLSLPNPSEPALSLDWPAWSAPTVRFVGCS